MATCDERLITQALTNVYKNAGESVTRRFDATGADDLKGLVRIWGWPLLCGLLTTTAEV